MLYFVGVGPGDPELLTLKAIHAIERSDVIALPDGGVAARVAQAHLEGKVLVPLRLPMTEDPSVLSAARAEAARTVEAHLARGATMAFLVLGDPSLYASCAYFMDAFSGRHPFEVVPGVPAMCAAAAALGVPLAAGREKLHILPGYRAGDELPDGNVVVMKAGKSLAALRDACAGREAHVAQNLGMPDVFCAPLAETDEAGYFTTVIVKRKRECP